MPLTLACPCGKQLKVKEELAGKKVKCPGCGKIIVAPAAAPVAVEPEPTFAIAAEDPPSAPPPAAASDADVRVWALSPGIFENILAITPTVFCAAKVKAGQADDAKSDLLAGMLPRKVLGETATMIALDAIRDVADDAGQAQLVITYRGDEGKEKKILHIEDAAALRELADSLRGKMHTRAKSTDAIQRQPKTWADSPRTRPSRHEDADEAKPVPKALYALAVLPIGIPILTLGGIIPAVWGGALASAGFALAKRTSMPVFLRVLGLIGISLVGYIGLAVFLVVTAMMGDGESVLRDWWDDLTHRVTVNHEPHPDGQPDPDHGGQDGGRADQDPPVDQTHYPMEPGGQLFKIHDKDVHGLAVNVGPGELVSASTDKLILSHGYTGRLTLKGPGGTAPIAFAPDGKRLIYRDLQTIKVWDISKPEVLKMQFPGQAFALSSDGKRLAAGIADIVRLFDFDTGKELASERNIRMHPSAMAFSPDGKTLAVLSSSEREVVLCDGDTLKERVKCIPDRPMTSGSLCFGPDGKWLAVASDEPHVRIVETATGIVRRQIRGDLPELIWSLAISPDGTLLATGNRAGFVRIWEAQTGNEIKLLRGGVPMAAQGKGIQPYAVRVLTFSPDGTALFAGSVCGDVRRWDLEIVIGRVPGKGK